MTFDDVWVEVHRDGLGRIQKVEVCDNKGQRVNLPITGYTVEQGVSDPGTACLNIFHGRVEYK